jgi:guanyl-specific ribonuclease Sa
LRRCNVSASPSTGVAASALPASKTAVMRRVNSATSPSPPSSSSQQAASSSLLALAMMELPAKVSLTGS